MNFLGSSLRWCFKYGMRCIVPCCLPSRATTCKGMLKVAKVKYTLRIASGLNLPWYKSMEWNMEENFRMEWNMESKIFSMEWKKTASMKYGKSSSIPFHILPCRYQGPKWFYIHKLPLTCTILQNLIRYFHTLVFLRLLLIGFWLRLLFQSITRFVQFSFIFQLDETQSTNVDRKTKYQKQFLNKANMCKKLLLTHKHNKFVMEESNIYTLWKLPNDLQRVR